MCFLVFGFRENRVPFSGFWLRVSLCVLVYIPKFRGRLLGFRVFRDRFKDSYGFLGIRFRAFRVWGG